MSQPAPVHCWCRVLREAGGGDSKCGPCLVRENARLKARLDALTALPPSSPVADSPTSEREGQRDIFIAAIRTLREHCRVEAACTAGHPNYRERQYTFMLKLDTALQIIDLRES